MTSRTRNATNPARSIPADRPARTPAASVPSISAVGLQPENSPQITPHSSRGSNRHSSAATSRRPLKRQALRDRDQFHRDQQFGIDGRLPLIERQDRPLQAKVGVPDIVHLVDRKIDRLQFQTDSLKKKGALQAAHLNISHPEIQRHSYSIFRSGFSGPKCLSMTIGSAWEGFVIVTPSWAACSVTKNSSYVSWP